MQLRLVIVASGVCNKSAAWDICSRLESIDTNSAKAEIGKCLVLQDSWISFTPSKCESITNLYYCRLIQHNHPFHCCWNPKRQLEHIVLYRFCQWQKQRIWKYAKDKIVRCIWFFPNYTTKLLLIHKLKGRVYFGKKCIYIQFFSHYLLNKWFFCSVCVMNDCFINICS